MNEQTLALTTQLVVAFVSHNQVAAADLPNVIRTIGAAINGSTAAPTLTRPPSAVSIDKSVTHENVTCLECGRRFLSLRRHLRTGHGMTPEQYRDRWGLRRNYPMVAPAYSAQRSQLAKDAGLGRAVAP